nr:hypothetical protein [Mesorhizobium sp.]
MDKRLTVRVDSELAAAVDRFIADDVIPTTSKQDAVRHIMHDWLSAKGYLGDAQRIDEIHPSQSPNTQEEPCPQTVPIADL